MGNARRLGGVMGFCGCDGEAASPRRRELQPVELAVYAAHLASMGLVGVASIALLHLLNHKRHDQRRVDARVECAAVFLVREDLDQDDARLTLAANLH